jgi:hypothetical protein
MVDEKTNLNKVFVIHVKKETLQKSAGFNVIKK